MYVIFCFVAIFIPCMMRNALQHVCTLVAQTVHVKELSIFTILIVAGVSVYATDDAEARVFACVH